MPRRGDEPGRLSCAGETCPRRKGGSLDAIVSHGSGRTPSSPARPGITLDEPRLLSRHEDGAELAMALWRPAAGYLLGAIRRRLGRAALDPGRAGRARLPPDRPGRPPGRAGPGPGARRARDRH